VISCVVDNLLKDYQRKRLFSFLAPKIDPLGAGYNIIQSKISIGSGRIFGKGLFQGTQGKLGFLPAKHSDFIFSIIGEEMGFCGSLLILILFFALIYRALVIAHNARDKFGALISIGIASLLGINAVLNISMSIGLFPVIGIPLPFVSYGGSALVANFIMIGILQSIYIRRTGY
jgi:rod shape determining protein RodA